MYFFFFFNDTATTEIYTLSLHDALPISRSCSLSMRKRRLIAGESSWYSEGSTSRGCSTFSSAGDKKVEKVERSEEHTSELQSRLHLVCRLLLEKKKK